MKGRLLLALVLVSAVSANTFAAEIKNGKLLSHKEWKKGNITGTFKEVIKKSTTLDLMRAKYIKARTDDSADSVYLENDINAPDGVVGDDAVIVGTNDITIMNTTALPHTYTITTTMATCVAPGPGGGFCIAGDSLASQNVVLLEPMGTYFSTVHPSVSEDTAMPGDGFAVIQTSVQIDNAGTTVHTSKWTHFTVSAPATK